MPNISDYDSSGYDYTKYWEKRQYEAEVEARILTRLLPLQGNHLVDLGGSFGRLAPIYQPRFNQATIFDYSELALNQATELILKQGWQNVHTAQGDIYHLPFRDGTFDCAIMIRVLHHLEMPELALKEIFRVLKPKGILILEVANKINLKASMRAWLKGEFNFRQDLTPVQHVTTKINNETGIFYNFHPQHIQHLLTQQDFVIESETSVSNLRLPFLKSLLSAGFMASFDTVLQPFFTPFQLGPSIWFKLRRL